MTFLEDIPDFRRAQGKRFELKHVLLFSILALLSNAKSYRDIESFMKKRLPQLKKDFGLQWKAAPSYVTIRTIFNGLASQDLEAAFRAYSAKLRALTEASWGSGQEMIPISFDGKSLRGSLDHFAGKKALQQLSAFMVKGKIILAHVNVSEKSNEIPAVQELIEVLDLQGCVFTVDAMHCQKKLSPLPKKRAIPCSHSSRTTKVL